MDSVKNGINNIRKHFTSYMVDGKVLPMPLARGFEYPYKTEHWLPTIIIPA